MVSSSDRGPDPHLRPREQPPVEARRARGGGKLVCPGVGTVGGAVVVGGAGAAKGTMVGGGFGTAVGFGCGAVWEYLYGE